jgi:hypothetical protein
MNAENTRRLKTLIHIFVETSQIYRNFGGLRGGAERCLSLDVTGRLKVSLKTAQICCTSVCVSLLKNGSASVHADTDSVTGRKYEFRHAP